MRMLAQGGVRVRPLRKLTARKPIYIYIYIYMYVCIYIHI